MDKLREQIARLVVGGIEPLKNAIPYQPAYDTADQILALLKEKGYVKLASYLDAQAGKVTQ